jgi:CheY-like chemotaxis protein
MSLREKNILYAEDDPNDILIFQMMFERAKLPHHLDTVPDGQAAIDWLSGKGVFQDRKKTPFPDILVLDLKMPRKSGFDVLEWVRSKPDLAKLPVVILSSSDHPGDVKRAEQLGATNYFVKSPSFQELIDFLNASE